MSIAKAKAGFTLIELLIVVAIIAILAAIAVPNFLNAQARAKVSRVKSDMRAAATAIESFRVDNNEYPEGTDNPARMPQQVVDFLGPLAPGFYSLRTRGTAGEIAGISFFTLTTPIAYITSMPGDPFAGSGSVLPFAYRNAKSTGDGWVLTSVGPDTDLLAPGGVGTTNTANPLSTASDTNTPARLGDINERGVIHMIEGTSYTDSERQLMRLWLEDLSYDPTNGTISDGDIVRYSGVPR